MLFQILNFPDRFSSRGDFVLGQPSLHSSFKSFGSGSVQTDLANLIVRCPSAYLPSDKKRTKSPIGEFRRTDLVRMIGLIAMKLFLSDTPKKQEKPLDIVLAQP